MREDPKTAFIPERLFFMTALQVWKCKDDSESPYRWTKW